MQKRRAVSQVVGSLAILGVVSSIGSVILFNGMDEIAAFSYDLSFHDQAKNKALREDVIFEHIRFVPLSGGDIEINLKNIGTVESVVDTISILKTDDQSILLNRNQVIQTIPLDGGISIVFTDLLSGGDQWGDSTYVDSEYHISVTTSRGNFFTTVATPFNT